MNPLTKILLFCLVLAASSPSTAQSLFEQDSLLEIELTGPISSLVDDKEDRSEWPFSMKVAGQQIDLTISARGNSRMRICDFPQLKFNLKAAETAGTPFQGLGSLKLVTRCKKDDRSATDVLDEYAAYRIFSLFSDVSFRVRLVHIIFEDTENQIDERYREGYGFFIEPFKQLANRVHGQPSNISAVALGWLDENQAALVYVFQYLIANTDWSLIAPENRDNCCHNIRLIEIDSKHYLVPYDFDLAGLVNTRYARPDPSLSIKRVRHRLYRGFCTNQETLREAIAAVRSKEAAVLGVIENLPVLDGKEKSRQLDYLEKFFTMAGNEDKLIESFEKKCLS